MSGNEYCNLTVAAQRCCPTIIAVAHDLFFHKHRLHDMDEWMMQLRMAMRDLNTAYTLAEAKYQNGAPSAEASSSS